MSNMVDHLVIGFEFSVIIIGILRIGLFTFLDLKNGKYPSLIIIGDCLIKAFLFLIKKSQKFKLYDTN